MNFKIKDNIDLSILRNYGFELGKILKKQPVYNEVFDGCSYMDDWWHFMVFPIDEDTNLPRMNYDSESYMPILHVWVDTRNNILYAEFVVESSYHTDTEYTTKLMEIVLNLNDAGIIEKV